MTQKGIFMCTDVQTKQVTRMKSDTHTPIQTEVVTHTGRSSEGDRNISIGARKSVDRERKTESTTSRVVP